MKTTSLLSASIVALLVHVVPSLAATGARIEIVVLPTNYAKGSLVISSDAKHHAFVTGSSGSQRVVRDGVESDEFQACSLPVFSPTGKVFFWGVKDRKVVLSADGKIIPTSFESEGSLRFSEDGAHWVAYGAEPMEKGGRTVTPGSIVVIIDGVESGKYADISTPSFSRDGQHVAWLVLDTDQRMSLVMDQKVSTTFEKPKIKCSFIMKASVQGPNMHMLSSARFMADGNLIALAQDANGWTVYKAGKPVSSYGMNVWGGGGYSTMFLSFDGSDSAAAVHARSLVISEEAAVAAWWERPAGKDASWRVVIDGKAADTFMFAELWSAQPPVLSRDGKRIAYAADFAAKGSKKQEVHVVVDGTKNGPYAHAWGVRFSDDGKHYAYAASDGTDGDAWSYFLDGKAISPAKYSSAYGPVLSADGKHVAWKAERDKKVVLVLDGNEVATAEDVVWGPEVDKSGAAKWIIREGTKVIRVDAAPK